MSGRFALAGARFLFSFLLSNFKFVIFLWSPQLPAFPRFLLSTFYFDKDVKCIDVTPFLFRPWVPLKHFASPKLQMMKIWSFLMLRFAELACSFSRLHPQLS